MKAFPGYLDEALVSTDVETCLISSTPACNSVPEECSSDDGG